MIFLHASGPWQHDDLVVIVTLFATDLRLTQDSATTITVTHAALSSLLPTIETKSGFLNVDQHHFLTRGWTLEGWGCWKVGWRLFRKDYGLGP